MADQPRECRCSTPGTEIFEAESTVLCAKEPQRGYFNAKELGASSAVNSNWSNKQSKVLVGFNLCG